MLLEKLNLSHPLFCVHRQWCKPTESSWRPECPDSYFTTAASMPSHRCLRCRWHSPHYYPGLRNLGCYFTSPWGCAMLPQVNSGLRNWSTSEQQQADLWQLIKPWFPCFQKGRAGQADFLRNPGNYLFFQNHSGSGLILGINGDDNFWTVNSRLLAYIKITNFLPNGTAITVRNDEGYEWTIHGSVNQVSTNGAMLSYKDS